VYCKNIDNLDSFTQAIALTKAVDKISTAHVNAHVKPEHYPLVGAALLQAIQDVLGEVVTPEILSGWKEAYEHLASILVRAETEKYEKNAKISAIS
jgi:nitric oxide dioxygenase